MDETKLGFKLPAFAFDLIGDILWRCTGHRFTGFWFLTRRKKFPHLIELFPAWHSYQRAAPPGFSLAQTGLHSLCNAAKIAIDLSG